MDNEEVIYYKGTRLFMSPEEIRRKYRQNPTLKKRVILSQLNACHIYVINDIIRQGWSGSEELERETKKTVIELYKYGMSISEIALDLELDEGDVSQWLKIEEPESVQEFVVVEYPDDFPERKAKSLYDRGYTDKEVAAVLCYTVDVVRSWKIDNLSVSS